MAEMIPDRLSGGSAGERKLFDIFTSKLPDDYICFYEPAVGNRYPDFVLICPDLGLLVIEVKGWYPKHILEADQHKCIIEDRGKSVEQKHPLRQAREYMYSLMDCCKAEPQCEVLLHTSGPSQSSTPHQNKFIFPFGHFAILSNMSREQLQAHPLGDLTKVFPIERNVARDEFTAWEDLSTTQLCDKLCRYFDPHWQFPPLTEQQLIALRYVLHPQARIPPAPGKSATPKNSGTLTPLKVLDCAQMKVAASMGQGHRLVFGVAGSGKTIILINRAKILAAHSPDHRVLVLCFNVPLAAYIRHCLNDYRNIEVRSFHDWAKEHGVPFRRSHESGEDDTGDRLLARMEAGGGAAGAFDAVLIDEAQDFHDPWFRCAVAAMRDPNDGDLLIVGDGNQDLYKKRRLKIKWKDMGIAAQSRTRYLSINYRNTKEIMRKRSDPSPPEIGDSPRISELPSVPACFGRGI